jgi:hypothetical protein
MEMPERMGRPVQFFCDACSAGFDMKILDIVADHSGGKADVYRKIDGKLEKDDTP